MAGSAPDVELFRDSSTVEQLAVNELVPGSNPGRGAERKHTRKGAFSYTAPRQHMLGACASGFEGVARYFMTEGK